MNKINSLNITTHFLCLIIYLNYHYRLYQKKNILIMRIHFVHIIYYINGKRRKDTRKS